MISKVLVDSSIEIEIMAEVDGQDTAIDEGEWAVQEEEKVEKDAAVD